MLPSLDKEIHGSCAIYARVSTKKQAEENTSISVQLEMARKYAADCSCTVYSEYVDPGASGRTDEGRPQFNAMIREALLPNPPFTLILVYDHSRFYRNVGLSEVTRATLRMNGVEVRSITQPIHDDGSIGSMAIAFQAIIDQQHSTTTAMKVRAGMAAAAREGFYVGGIVPFGYDLELVETRGSKEKNKLVIKEEEARVVRYMFDLYLGGAGIKTITARLNSERITNRRGKRWYQSVVGNILTTPTYAGRHQFRPTDWRTKKPLPRTEWIDIPCPAIVDEVTFQKVQRLLKERQPRMTPPRETTSDVLLAKVARCGSCGGALQVATGTSRNKTVYSYYKCAKRLGTGFCPGGNPVSISRDYLDDLVIQKVTDELLSPSRVQEIVTRAAQMQANARGTATTRVGQLKRQLAAAKSRESNLWDFAADQGLRAREGFVEKLDALQQEIAELKHLLSAQEQLIERSIRPLSPTEAQQKAAKMRQLLLDADIKRKQRFLRAVVEKIVVNEDSVEITGPELALAEAANDIDDRSAPRFAILTGCGGR